MDNLNKIYISLRMKNTNLDTNFRQRHKCTNRDIPVLSKNADKH